MEPGPEGLERAQELAERAIALDDSLANGHSLLAQIYLWRKEHDRAIARAERAVALAPNDADGYETLAEVLAWAGRPEDSLRVIRQAMRLNPHYPFFYLWTLGHASYMTRQTDAARMPSARSAGEPQFPSRSCLPRGALRRDGTR